MLQRHRDLIPNLVKGYAKQEQTVFVFDVAKAGCFSPACSLPHTLRTRLPPTIGWMARLVA